MLTLVLEDPFREKSLMYRSRSFSLYAQREVLAPLILYSGGYAM